MTLIEKIQNEISENEIMYATIAKPSHQMATAHTGVISGLMIALNLAKEHSDWIPCSERLPPTDTLVLVFTHFKEIVLAFITYEDERFVWMRDCSEDEWTTQQVTHWMALPQPPREVQNG